jgi:hypothetical protein
VRYALRTDSPDPQLLKSDREVAAEPRMIALTMTTAAACALVDGPQ